MCRTTGLRALAAIAVTLAAAADRPAAAGDTYASLSTLAGSPDVAETACAMSIRADGPLAEVTTKQTLTNRSKRDHEVLYRFPLPAGAAVTGLTVKLPGGKTADAVLVDSTAAITPVADPDGIAAAPDLALLRLYAMTDSYAVYELRLYPVAAGAQVEVTTRWVAPLRYDGGRQSLRVPARGAAANLAAPEVSLSAAPPAGARALDEVTGGGKVLARDVKARGAWTFEAKNDDDLVVELAPRFDSSKPVAVAARVPLADNHGLYAISIMVPPPTPAEIPHYDRVLFVIDTSRSMSDDGAKAARALVDQVLGSLGEVRVEAVTYARKPARVFGAWTAVDRDARAKLDRAVVGAAYDNGSDLGAALSSLRPILNERTREEQDVQKKTGAKPSTLVVIVSDGVAPLALTGARAVDRFGGDLLDQVFIVSLTIYPAGAVAPGVEEPSAGQLAMRAGGRSLVVRDADAAAAGARLGAELARPAPLRGLALDEGTANLDIDLPSELAPGQGKLVIGEYRGEWPKKVQLHARLGGDAVDVTPAAADAALADAALPLWLGRSGPDAFVPLSQRADDAPDDPASYKGDVWTVATRGYQKAAADAHAITPWTSLVALAPGDAFGKDRAAFVKKWGPRRFGRLPPPAEDGNPPDAVSVSPRSRREALAQSPRAFEPTGDIDETIAKRLMQTYVVPQARACYLQALRTDPNATGDIDLVVEMARGEVTTVSIAASTFKSAQVDLCVIDAAYTIQVPRVGLGSERDAIVVVRYPLHFRLAQKEPSVTDEAPTGVTRPVDPKQGGTPIAPDDPSAHKPQGE
jgi:hypothetical protein